MLVTRTTSALLITLLMLSGCKAIQPKSTAATTVQPEPAKPLSATEQFLSRAAAGSIATLSNSPWGNNVEITALERYFAASGQTCLRLNIQHGQSQDTPALACQQRDGSWAATRLLTVH